MSKLLKLADGLSLPLDAVTEKLAFLGRTGSGKTYAAMKLAELMLEAGAHVGAIDPVGVWRALRVPVAAGAPSFEVVVFGGLYGDVPLQPTAGALIADLICDRELSFVLDISQWIPSEQQRFLLAFADRFFHRKKAAPSAVHLFMEECQEYIPENPSGLEAATLGAMQRMWKLGRNFGIGGSLISQRPQEIAKKALNMSGTLFAFQMTGPQERKAIKAWVADKGVAIDIEAVLQKLDRGQPHVESPTFLEVSATVRILPRVTADLSSTPKVGANPAARRALTPIDVEQLRVAMAETIERAKADDPKELKKQLTEANRQLLEYTKKGISSAVPDKAPAGKSAPALTEGDRDLLGKLIEALTVRATRAQETLRAAESRADRLVQTAVAEYLNTVRNVTMDAGKEIEAALGRAGFTAVLEKLERLPAPVQMTIHPPHVQPVTRQALMQVARSVAQPNPNSRPLRPTSPTGHSAVKGGAFRSMLVALAQAGRPLADNQVAARSGMALSGTFDKYLGQQRTNGWVDGTRSALTITPDGLAALGAYEPLPTGVALQQYWLDYVGAGKKRAMLEVLIAAYPMSLPDEHVANNADMALSGTFDKYLGQLRTLQLVSGSRQALRASEELFS